jgi:glc operon protein GlcG
MPELDLAAADRMTEAAFDYARKNALRIAVAVLDGGGNVIRISRMDGCNFLSPDIARMAPVQGALPIFDGARCVGAIGASGARSNEDEDAVRAGLQAAGFSDAPNP